MTRWLYVLQQRLAITNREATALATVGFLLFLGLVVGEVRSRGSAFGDAAYADSDRLFREGVALLSAADTTTESDAGEAVPHPPDSVGARDGIAEEGLLKAGPEETGSRIDINAASVEELQILPRIGPKMAARIVAFRTAHGPFRTLQDIMQVRGIGPATLEKLRPHVEVGSVPAPP